MPNTFDYMIDSSRKNVVLTYKGNITNDFFKNLIQLAEVKLEVIETNCKLKKKVFGVIVEVLQNIYHHFEDQLVKEKYFNITFTIRKIKSGYLILTGNPISKHKVKNLQENIDSINSMSPNELKGNYRKILGNNDISPKGGAGLGLLHMVRHSGSKVDYKFQAFNKDYSFFNLKVEVSS
ncbi:MAG: SiaB family protein kinase [Bacteroidota bacterium]|nr:SiaB family protein kinase [Bacteroidota bacterium]